MRPFQKNRIDNDLSQIVDTDLSTFIEKKATEYTAKHIQTAQKLATLDFKGMPKTTSIKDFLGAKRADFQFLVDHIEKSCNGGLQKVKGQSHISKASEDDLDINRKIESLDLKLTPLKGKLDESGKKLKPEVRNWFYVFIPLLIFIGGIELIGNFDVFSSLGGSMISSIGIAVLTLACTFWYAHFIPDKIRRYVPNSAKKQVILFTLSIIPIAVVYYYFSSQRIAFLLAMNPDLEGVISSSPWVFTVINCFAYVISCWIIWAYKPSKETILAYKKYRNDTSEIKKLEIEREQLCQQKTELPSNLRGKLTKHYNVLILGKQFEQEVVTRYHRCFEEMKMELYMRTNGACAPLFTGNINQDLPPLQLNFSDKDIHKPLQSSMTQFMSIVLLLLTLTSCTSKIQPSLSLSVMDDYTDKHIPKPDIDGIQPLIKNTVDKDGSCDFRYTSITDASFNPIYDASIKVKPRFGNTLEHLSKKRKFYRTIEGFLSSKKDTLQSYPHSSILTPVLRELALLKGSKSDTKILLLYSDLLESSSIYNVYDTYQLRQLLKDYNKVVEIITNKIEIPKNLNGLTLHIIYYPKNAQDDQLFKEMLKVWRSILEPSGLHIQLGIAKPISTVSKDTHKKKQT